MPSLKNRFKALFRPAFVPEVQKRSNPVRLSIIVNFFNMKREAARTLYSLSSEYQQGVSQSDYEVIAVDNGSSEPLSPEEVTKYGPNFKYYFHDTKSVSPSGAVNFAAGKANGENVAVIVDGARMVTPGLVRLCISALEAQPISIVCALAWHLGPDIQRLAIEKGYNRDEEDRLLASIDWQRNGYGLFDISTIAPASADGFLGNLPPEASFLAMRKDLFDRIGGLNEAFVTPGGGLVCHDTLKKAVEIPDAQPIIIFGEGTFHQMHGGIATNSKKGQHPIGMFHEEYERIVGQKYTAPETREPLVLGAMKDGVKPFLFRQ
ncbi:MAG: glycosyltransferase family A protein [Rhizobiaceae bacterium]|nr:glycosyltransferase family A protein [Rhizobiaceae bacterium]